MNGRFGALGCAMGSANIGSAALEQPGVQLSAEFDARLMSHAPGELARAIDALTAAYLFLVPGSEDAEQVRRLVLQARDLRDRVSAEVGRRLADGGSK